MAERALASIAPQGNLKSHSGPTLVPTVTTGAPTGWWYAVAKGKGGGSGIYDSWAEASLEVNGVSGAIYRKFRDYEDAWEFVQKYLDSLTTSRGADTLSGKKAYEDPKCKPERPKPPEFPMGIDKSPRDFMREATSSLLPLLELAGSGPSTKKEEEIFGIDMGSEIEPRNGISPPGLTADTKQNLANTMVDVVALPGGYHGGNEEDTGGNDMALLGAAMQELVHQGRTTTENSMKSDLNW